MSLIEFELFRVLDHTFAFTNGREFPSEAGYT